MTNSPAGLDAFLPAEITPKDGAAVSHSGKYAASCVPGGPVLLEYTTDNTPPIELVRGESVGFYGAERDLIAIADGGVLRIIHLHRMEIIATIQIRPGTLFVPSSANSPYIGVVSPGGNAFLIDDEGVPHKTPLSVQQGYNVLWSSSVRPIGYSWSDEYSAFLYIRSGAQDDGATISSSDGMILFTVWTNHALGRHEAYLTTYDEPHVLKRVFSTPEGAVVEKVGALPPGSAVHDLITLPDGRPAVLYGVCDGRAVAEIVPPSSRVSEYVVSRVTDPSSRNWVEVSGMSSMVMWSQTPITPEYPSVVNYGITGHPVHRLSRPSGRTGEPRVPTTNTLYRIDTVDGAVVDYRYVSPFPEKGFLADTALVIVDDEGLASSGRYSPTVTLCYDENIPVALIPVVHKMPISSQIDDLSVDIVDVVADIRTRRLAREVVVMATGEMCQAAVAAWRHKRNGIRNLILVSPDNLTLSDRRIRRSTGVTVVDSQPVAGHRNTLVVNDLDDARQVLEEAVH